MPGPTIINPAHGDAREGGAELVAETPKLRELGTPDADRTATGLARAARRGRPFQVGNTAGANRGASLTRITADEGTVVDPDSPDERRRARRKAQSLVSQRRRELEVQTGGAVSSAVRVELVAWARATAWAELYDRAGDSVRSVAFAEKASGHGLKALGIAEREAASRPRGPSLLDQMRARVDAELQAKKTGGPDAH